nr:GNAT family N-acetyltransferase [Epibacterium ulvae]
MRLRHHRCEDITPMVDLFASDWARYMGGPISHDELWRWIAAETISWEWLGYGSWAVELRETDTLIGQVGINKPPRFPEVELGWIVFPAYEGQGYAYEAASAARDWGFETRGLQTLVSYIDPQNARSIALAKRLGGVLDTKEHGEDPEDLVYRHIPQTDGSVEAYA